jgi:hypothetical protein
MRRWIRRLCAAGAGFLFVICPEQAPAQEPDYDIVYVRWPRRGTEILLLPQAEDPYRVEPGADLVLLHPDQSEEVLVDCDTCCVQDPTISFDGEWVYYTKMLDARNERSPSLLFKMHIAGPNADRKELQLTYADGFTGSFHSGNNHPDDNLAHHFSIRDMGPAPIPGGRIVFTSNRQATIAFRQGSAFSVSDARDSSVMQLYVMDDHDGRLRTSDLSNLRQVGFGSLHMTLHPMVLQDGRIAFSNWDDGGGKFLYAMTTLYVMNPDGSHLEALTEPHDHHKNVDHFATQLSDGSIVVAQYYPSFNFGFGHLCRFPMNVDEPAYTRSPSKAVETYTGGQISFRNFDRKGWVSVTPHTSPSDCPAPNFSGKYCMPCAAPRGSCLVAYSPGGVNHNLTCSEGKIQVVDSGIYLIPDAVNGAVYDPRDSRQLVEIVNDPRYNEIWPRAVLPYMEVHGVREPRRLAWHDAALPEDDRVAPGEPVAVVGTSSLYNRESAPLGGDPFRASDGRELHSGAWTLQGSEAGVIKNSDIYAVRLIAVSPKAIPIPYLAVRGEFRRSRGRAQVPLRSAGGHVRRGVCVRAFGALEDPGRDPGAEARRWRERGPGWPGRPGHIVRRQNSSQHSVLLSGHRQERHDAFQRADVAERRARRGQDKLRRVPRPQHCSARLQRDRCGPPRSDSRGRCR